MLIQLAQEGLINPKSRETPTALVAKGIVIRRRADAINLTFRDFLQGIERTGVVQNWSGWKATASGYVRRIVASVLAVGGAFYFLTQGFGSKRAADHHRDRLPGVPLVKNVAGLLVEENAAPV